MWARRGKYCNKSWRLRMLLPLVDARPNVGAHMRTEHSAERSTSGKSVRSRQDLLQYFPRLAHIRLSPQTTEQGDRVRFVQQLEQRRQEPFLETVLFSRRRTYGHHTDEIVAQLVPHGRHRLLDLTFLGPLWLLPVVGRRHSIAGDRRSIWVRTPRVGGILMSGRAANQARRAFSISTSAWRAGLRAWRTSSTRSDSRAASWVCAHLIGLRPGVAISGRVQQHQLDRDACGVQLVPTDFRGQRQDIGLARCSPSSALMTLDLPALT